MNLSKYARDIIINRALRNQAFTPPATIYASLFLDFDEDEPGDDTTEVAIDGFTRVPIAFGAATARTITSSTSVIFPVASEATASITHIGLYDAATDGNLLAWDARSSPGIVPEGEQFVIGSGQVTIGCAGGLADAQATALLDHLFRAQAYTPATSLYLAALNGYVSDSSLTEVANSNSYARLGISFPAPTAGRSSNAAPWSFATPSGSWGTVAYAGIYSSGTYGGGSLIARGALTNSKVINTGRILYFEADGFGVRVS